MTTTLVHTPPAAPSTPARQSQVKDAVTPGLLKGLWKIKDRVLTDAQLRHLPEATRAAILALQNLKPGDIPLDHEALLAVSPAKNNGSRPPPYESDPENLIGESETSGLSDASEPAKGLETDPEDMEVDTTAASGRKKVAGRRGGKKVVEEADEEAVKKKVPRKKVPRKQAASKDKQAEGVASGSHQARRVKPTPSVDAGQGNEPCRQTRQTAAQRASVRRPVQYDLFY